MQKAPCLPWVPSTMNPFLVKWVSALPRFFEPLTTAGLHTATEAGVPVTWCWLTLTRASRTAQG